MGPSSALVDPDQVSDILLQTDIASASTLSVSNSQAYSFLSGEESRSGDLKEICVDDTQEKEAYIRDAQEKVACTEEVLEKEGLAPDAIDLHPYQEYITPATKLQRARGIFRRYWIWETIGCLLSMTCAFTASLLLLHEDGTEVENWNWTLHPNVVVSAISSLVKICFAMVLSEILSQLKWTHFQQANPLEHLRILDNASRGPVGSVMLLWSSRSWLASIAAILTICGLLVDPFFQLALNYQTISVVDKSQRSSYLYSKVFDPDTRNNTFAARFHGEANYAIYPKATKEMVKAIDHGLSPSNHFMNSTCPTGNCIWPRPITMLGVCGKCINTTALMKPSCSIIVKPNCSTTLSQSLIPQFYDPQTLMMVEQSYNFGIPTRIENGTNNSVELECNYDFPTLASSYQTLTLSAKGNIMEDGSFEGMENLLWNSTMDESVKTTLDRKAYIIRFFALQSNKMESTDMLLPDARAWTCDLTWCAKTLDNVNISGGNRLFTPADESHLYYRHSLDKPRLRELYAKHDQRHANSSFFVNRHAVKLLTDQLSMAFNVSYGSRKFLQMDISGNDVFAGDTLITSQVATSQDLHAVINKLASSLTDMVRSGVNHTEEEGSTMINKTIIRIHWAWLALPISLPILTGILLAIIIVRSRAKDVALWKSDPLALLFHRLDDADLAPYRTANPDDLDSISKKLFVEFSSDRSLTLVRANVV